MKKSLPMLLMLSTLAFGDTAVVKSWKVGTYSQSALITRNHVIYTIATAEKTYQIARRHEESKPEFNVGDTLEVRFEKNFCIVSRQNKTQKFEVIGVEDNK